MHSPQKLLTGLILASLGATSTYADCNNCPDSKTKGADTFNPDNYLTGGWGGTRADLVEKGIELDLTYTAEPEWNPVGGEKQSATYVHNIGLSALFDFEKLIGLPNTTFLIQGSQRSGNSLTEEAIGNAISVQQLYGGGQTYRLVEMRISNDFYDDRLHFSYGRLSTTNDFMTSPYYCQFVTNGFCGQPTSPFFNMNDGLSAYPIAVWGAMTELKPTDQSYLKAGIYEGDATDDNHGVDFDLGDNGVFLITELGLRPEEGLFGLPARYSVGAYYHTGDFSDVATDVNGNNLFVTGLPAREDSDQQGYYTIIEQGLYRESSESDQGLTGIFTFVLSPDLDKSDMPYFMNAGLVYKGLLEDRPHDQTAFGFYTTWFSKDKRDAQEAAGLEGQDSETGIELNHQFQFTPYFYLRPDVQYIINPNGLASIDNALVLGCEIGLTF
ncbi:MAG: carbohydrate porin [Puniceicoccales bacterium]